MSTVLEIISNHISDQEDELKTLKERRKELKAIEEQIEIIEKEIEHAKAFKSSIQPRKRKTTKKPSSKRRSRTDRSQLKDQVLQLINDGGSSGIARGDLVTQLGIKGDKAAEGFLGTFLVKLQEDNIITRGDPEPGKKFGPYVSTSASSESQEESGPSTSNEPSF